MYRFKERKRQQHSKSSESVVHAYLLETPSRSLRTAQFYAALRCVARCSHFLRRRPPVAVQCAISVALLSLLAMPPGTRYTTCS